MNVLFTSPKEYIRFACAKGFYEPGAPHLFDYQSNFVEKIGRFMLKPITYICDKTLKNIRNPAVLSCLTIVALALVTLAYYPGSVTAFIKSIIILEAEKLRLGLNILVQFNILGLGIRTVGRLGNYNHLLPAWRTGKIVPIGVGSQISEKP